MTARELSMVSLWPARDIGGIRRRRGKHRASNGGGAALLHRALRLRGVESDPVHGDIHGSSRSGAAVSYSFLPNVGFLHVRLCVRVGVRWKGAMKMTVALNHLLIVGASALALLVSTSVSMASIGVPKGRPYYGGPSPAGGQTFRSTTPSYSMPGESRQSFSYEPGEEANRPASGGCSCGSKSASSTTKAPEVAKETDGSRQSYSYEPAEDEGTVERSIRRSGSSSLSRKELWQYQKTDPRRNQR
jgi:hypothetical protein